MNKINNKCRTCLNESSKGMQSLKKTINDGPYQQRSFAEILNEVAKINIQNDKCFKMPQAICGCCSRKLKAAHAFVQQAQEVNEKLCSMLQQFEDGNKPLDCLQEVQIDIGFCTEIKIEGDNAYEHDRDENIAEAEFLNRGIKLKQENDSEEDTLAATLFKNEQILEDGKSIKDYLDVTYPDISIMNEMSDNGDNIFTNLKQALETSDNNSNNRSSFSSASNDDDWQNDSKKSTNIKLTLLTKKTKHSKKSKFGITTVKTEEMDQNNHEQVKCNECDKIFENVRLLSQHQRRNHVPEELKIQCQYCEAKFSRRHNMYAHMRRMHKTENLEQIQLQPKKPNAEKKFPCEQCTRSYTNKYKLIAHINSHHNPENINNPPKEKNLLPKKRFLCTLCGLKFDSTGNLNIHFRRHTGEKPFKCEFCDKAYPRLYDVTVHRRTHTGEKPYQCTLCEKTFRKSNKLKVHMRTHTNERPYKCTQCEKAFKQSKDLNIHKRTHTGERPYKCFVCHSTFTQSNSLRLHQIKQQHLEKPIVAQNIPEVVPTTAFPLCQPP